MPVDVGQRPYFGLGPAETALQSPPWKTEPSQQTNREHATENNLP
jgi:hypothetical protein